jgi:hypothetical protein
MMRSLIAVLMAMVAVLTLLCPLRAHACCGPAHWCCTPQVTLPPVDSPELAAPPPLQTVWMLALAPVGWELLPAPPAFQADESDRYLGLRRLLN